MSVYIPIPLVIFPHSQQLLHLPRSGPRYYVCEGNHRLLRTGPLSHLGLPEDLGSIDAAFVWGHNGRTYFFADTMYWRCGPWELHLLKPCQTFIESDLMNFLTIYVFGTKNFITISIFDRIYYL